MNYTKEDMWRLATQGVDFKSAAAQNDYLKDFEDIFIAKKMVKRFLSDGQINERLLINKIIMCLNTFGFSKANALIRMACQDNEYSVFKTFLIFLDRYDSGQGINVPLNKSIEKILRDLNQRYNINFC